MPAPSSPPLLIGAVDASPFFSPIAHRCRRYQALLLPHSPTSIIGLWLMTRGCHLWLMSRSCHLLRCILAMHGRSVTPPPPVAAPAAAVSVQGWLDLHARPTRSHLWGPGLVVGGAVCLGDAYMCVGRVPVCVSGGCLYVWRGVTCLCGGGHVMRGRCWLTCGGRGEEGR